MKSPADHIQTTRYRSPSHHSSESSTDVSKRLSHLLNPDQMEYLIDMLRMTIATQPQKGNSPSPVEQEATARSTPPLPPPRQGANYKWQSISRKALESSSLAKLQEHPLQRSLFTGNNKLY